MAVANQLEKAEAQYTVRAYAPKVIDVFLKHVQKFILRSLVHFLGKAIAQANANI